MKHLFTLLALVAGQAAASHCLIGWPGIVGSSTKDGDTDITVWHETPFSDAYLIGGNSNSKDFTEKSVCSSNGTGCAYLAVWNKVSQDFTQKWIFTKVFSVQDIKFQDFEDTVQDIYTFAVVFNEVTEQNGEDMYRHIITFNQWQGATATLGTTAYTMMEPYDPEQHDNNRHLAVMQDNRFHFVSNLVTKYQVNDTFFELDGATVLSVHAQEENTTDNVDVHIGTPTHKYMQDFGYDKDHIIQLATITLPRGRREYGNGVILGAKQTYEVVISRDITESGDPFTYKDNIYATKQTSSTSFYYFSHFSMAYINKADGTKLGDTVLHVAGSHSVRTNEIQAGTFAVDKNRELTPEDTKTFDMGKAIKILNVNTRPEYDLYHVYIAYREVGEGEAQVGKVLFVDMLDTSSAYSYDFSSSKVETKSGAIQKTIMNVHAHDDYYVFGGTTNYLEAPDVEYLGLDWTNTKRRYGYFEVYTDSIHCQGFIGADDIDFGIDYAEFYVGNIVQDQDFRNYLQEGTIKTPPITLNLGDRDDEDNWVKNLFEQQKIDIDGFPIEYQDWTRPDNEDGDEYPQYLFDIDGKLWMNKYEELIFYKSNAKGSIAVHILGAVGLLNSIIAFWMWFKFLKNFDNSHYWWTMLMTMITTGSLWIPMAVVWPVYQFGEQYMIRVVKIIAQMTYIGVFGAYWINLSALIYSTIVSREKAGSQITKKAGVTYSITYGAISAVNSTLSVLFVPRIVDWYEEEENLRTEKEKLVKIQEEAAENIARAENASGTSADDDIFIF